MAKEKKNPIKTVNITPRFDCTRFLGEHIQDEPCRFVEIEIKAESFLYKMIRKMIGAAYDVSQSRIPVEQIRQMLHKPEQFYTDNTTTVLKPQGLYLKKVEYEEFV
jgi:tRNA pseudouridine(38-40) synthase